MTNVRAGVFCCAVWQKFHPGWFRCCIVVCSAPSTSSVRTKTQSAWPESWTVLCTENAVISVSVFLEYASRRFCTVTILQKGRLGRGVVAGYQSHQSRFQLTKPFFLVVAVGLLILVKLVQSQKRVRQYWIGIQSQSTASSVWVQADVQCLLEYAHNVWMERPGVKINEIVSKHYSIPLEGIYLHTNSILKMSPSVNFGNFVASVFLATFFSQIGWCGELGTAHDLGAETVFGLSYLTIWPIHFWPVHFGPNLVFRVRPRRVGPLKGGPRRVGPEGWVMAAFGQTAVLLQ